MDFTLKLSCSLLPVLNLLRVAGGQFLAPLSSYSQTYCGKYPYQQNASDLCCNGYHFPNLPGSMHKACCQSSFYDTRLFGCDGSKTFLLSGAGAGVLPLGAVRQQVVDRVMPTNYYCGTNLYNPNSQFCCGCCGDGDRKVINKTDKYSLCCNGRWVVNPERVLACCGINAYDTRFYMCTPPLEVVPRRPPLQPFVPTDFCEGRGYNPQTDYCCGSSVLPKNSSTALCCNGNFFTVPDKSSYACCCDSFYNTAQQTCDKDCTVRPVDKGGPKPLDYCGDRIYNPLEDSCCGNVFIANNSIGHYLCCDNVYYANVHPNLACCGKNVYDIYHYRCQDYHIIPIQPATVTVVNNIELPRYCGATVPYDANEPNNGGLCCRGLYYPNADGLGQCCGSAFFVPNLHQCHEGVVFFNGAPLPQPSLLYLPPTHSLQSQSNDYLRNLAELSYAVEKDTSQQNAQQNQPQVAASSLWPLLNALRAYQQPNDKKTQQDALPFQQPSTIESEIPQLGQQGTAWGSHILVPRGQFQEIRSSKDQQVLNDAIPRPVQAYHNEQIFEQPRLNSYYGPVVPTGPVAQLPNGQMAVLANVEQISQGRKTNTSVTIPWPYGIPGSSLTIPAGVETQPATYRFQYLQPRDAPTFNGRPSQPPLEKARPLPASPYGYEYPLLCNGQPFDNTVHFCCGGQLIRIRPDPFQLCCGDIYYDNVNKDPSLKCCGRKVCRKARHSAEIDLPPFGFN